MDEILFGPKDRVAGRFVEYLVTFIDNLNVLRPADCTVGIGRRAVATHAGERDAVESIQRRGHLSARGRSVHRVLILNDGVGLVSVPMWNLRVLVSFVFRFAFAFAPARQIT